MYAPGLYHGLFFAHGVLRVGRADLMRLPWGLARTHLQHVATAAAIDLARLGDWFRAIPRAATRTSRFAALAAA